MCWRCLSRGCGWKRECAYFDIRVRAMEAEEFHLCGDTFQYYRRFEFRNTREAISSSLFFLTRLKRQLTVNGCCYANQGEEKEKIVNSDMDMRKTFLTYVILHDNDDRITTANEMMEMCVESTRWVADDMLRSWLSAPRKSLGGFAVCCQGI